MTGLTVATWNCEWRLPGSADAKLIREGLDVHAPDTICLTEAYAGLLEGGYLIESEPDYGYPLVEGRRKVLLWSRHPWERVDRIGHADLPPGRFVAGRTATPLGAVSMVGVCIPWREAHVRSGSRNRELWQDHLAYLDGLQQVLARLDGPVLVVGDFNQRVPRLWSPVHVYEAIEAALDGFKVATAGPIAPIRKAAIDHVAHRSDMTAREVVGLSNIAPDGHTISDHFGLVVRFAET